MSAYRILVTGSRSWTDEGAIHAPLSELLFQHGHVTLVHGACPQGADNIADQWAALRNAGPATPVTVERHPADWTVLGRRAGFARNAHMVQLGAQICLAFINPCTSLQCTRGGRHGSHGAVHCAHLAQRAGINVRRWPR
jgi:hypothetical protein